MKRCHVCQRTYSDDINFCLQDGAPLVDEPKASPGARDFAAAEQPQPGGRYEPPPPAYNAGGAPPPGMPPGGYNPPPRQAAPPRKRKVWPWVVGGVVVAGMGLAVVALIVGLVVMKNRPSRNMNNAGDNLNARRQTNRGVVTPGANRRATNGDDDTPAGRQALLAELSKLENDWIRANIKADKKALGQILADEYRGTSADGTTQTKEEYLATIRPDRSARSWSSEDVTLDFDGDKAVLSGVLIWNSTDGTRRYRFVDAFVKRDGRWQAVSSVTSPEN